MRTHCLFISLLLSPAGPARRGGGRRVGGEVDGAAALLPDSPPPHPTPQTLLHACTHTFFSFCPQARRGVAAGAGLEEKFVAPLALPRPPPARMYFLFQAPITTDPADMKVRGPAPLLAVVTEKIQGRERGWQRGRGDHELGGSWALGQLGCCLWACACTCSFTGEGAVAPLASLHVLDQHRVARTCRTGRSATSCIARSRALWRTASIG